MRILLAISPIRASLVQAALVSVEGELSIVGDAGRAIDRLNRSLDHEPFAVVVIDCQLRGLVEAGLCDWIEEHKTRVIFLTEQREWREQWDDRIRAASLAAAGFLLIPDALDSLPGLIRALKEQSYEV